MIYLRDMDLPQLESAIKALEKSLDSLSVWLTVWTALVVLGLGVELADDLKKVVKERPMEWTKHLLVIGGGLLITIGVAGELFVQFKASKVETVLRADSHQVEALLNKQAADANKEAEEVRKEAASALIQISQAKKDAELARRDAESFKLDIAKANAHAAEASQKAEEERLARMKIEERLAPRRMTAQQIQSIRKGLERFRGQWVRIYSMIGDPESQAYANEFANALASIGWQVELFPGTPFNFEGVGVAVQDQTDVPEAAEAMAHTFEESGISVYRTRASFVEINGNRATSKFELYVSKKGEVKEIDRTPIPIRIVGVSKTAGLTNVSSLSDEQLEAAAKEFAAAMRSFESVNQVQLTKEWRVTTQPIPQGSYRYVFEEYRARAINIRDELLKRLKMPASTTNALDADTLAGASPMGDAANYLDELVKSFAKRPR